MTSYYGLRGRPPGPMAVPNVPWKHIPLEEFESEDKYKVYRDARRNDADSRHGVVTVEHPLSEAEISRLEVIDLNNLHLKCPHCKANLTKEDAIVREYVNKSGGDSLYADGHYDSEGNFESDSFKGFDGDSYDCLDNSDTCMSCDKQL
jgi:hypothetical protein